MEQTGQKQPFSGGTNSWLQEEMLLKIHLELTLLAIQQGLSREISEEIAGECLSSLWMTYEKTGFPYPIKPFLLIKMQALIQEYRRNIKYQQLAETFHLLDNKMDVVPEENFKKTLSLILDDFIPLLEMEEQAVLRPILIYGMDLPAIAASLNYPLSKVRKHYKHAVFRLQKHLGLWRKRS